MKTGSFTYEVRAACTPRRAMQVLTDLPRHTGLNPLIVRVDEVEPTHGGSRAYLIHDRLAWGPLTFPMTYRAEVLRATEEEVIMLAVQQLSTTVRNHTHIEPSPDGVVLHCEFTMIAPRVLFGYAFRQGHAAHMELARRLPAAMAGGPSHS